MHKASEKHYKTRSEREIVSSYSIVVRWVRSKQDGESSEEEKREHGGNKDPIAEEASNHGSASRSDPTTPDRHRHYDRSRTNLKSLSFEIRFQSLLSP